jgi:cold shock CspA family protein
LSGARHTGILRNWDEERGFGFIAPTQGGREVFVHVSAWPRGGGRPVEGETLSYHLGPGKDGRPQALEVHRQAFGQPKAPRPRRHEHTRPRASIVGVVTSAMLMLGAAAWGYRHLTHSPAVPASQASATPTATVQPIAISFRCDGRRFCSQMTSCAEATYFLKHCPDTQMDGNHDGVPCEMQWCSAR